MTTNPWFGPADDLVVFVRKHWEQRLVHTNLVGTVSITSCFSLVCGTQTINVTAGVPTDLIVTPLSATISADDTLTITAHMVDQHGNTVPGESITYTPTNRSMSAVMPNIFQPYAVGSHVMRVAHGVPSGEFVDVAVWSKPEPHRTLS